MLVRGAAGRVARVRLRRFAQHIRQERQDDEHERERDGQIHAGRVRDPVRDIAQVRDGEHRAADEVLEIDGCAVGRIVCVSLRIKVLIFRINGDDAVRDDIEILIDL